MFLFATWNFSNSIFIIRNTCISSLYLIIINFQRSWLQCLSTHCIVQALQHSTELRSITTSTRKTVGNLTFVILITQYYICTTFKKKDTPLHFNNKNVSIFPKTNNNNIIIRSQNWQDHWRQHKPSTSRPRRWWSSILITLQVNVFLFKTWLKYVFIIYINLL